MPMRKRMLPMARSARSKRKIRPRRRKSAPSSLVRVVEIKYEWRVRRMRNGGIVGEAYPLTAAAEGYAYFCS